MNLQEIFDTAAIGVIKQGRASIMAPFDNCVYRSPDGAKCAAGHLIPDEIYDPSMDSLGSSTFSEVVRHFSSRLPAYLTTDEAVRFITFLQVAHDTASEMKAGEPFIASFLGEVREVAVGYGLSMDNVLKVAKELGYA